MEDSPKIPNTITDVATRQFLLSLIYELQKLREEIEKLKSK